MRRTGRTTRLLAQAVAAAARGERVTIVGHNEYWSKDMYHRVMAALEALGISKEFVRVRYQHVGQETRGMDDTFFVDHFAKGFE